MKFSYRYPTMIRGIPPRCRTVKNAVVWMENEVVIPEYAASDISVACEIETADGREVYRYYEGQFYKRCGRVSEIGDDDGEKIPFATATLLSTRLACEIAERWHHHDPLLKEAIWPRIETSNITENEWDMRLGTLGGAIPWRLPIGSEGLIVLTDPLEDDVEYFETKARDIAASVICIDGSLWTTTAEPVLFMVPRTGSPFVLSDMTEMLGPLVRSAGQPTPYGEAHHRDVPIGDWWNWKAFALSVNEHRTVSDIMFMMAREGSLGRSERERTIPTINVHMPEIFGKDLPEVELVRVSKCLCAHIFPTLKGKSFELRNGKEWSDFAPPAIRRIVTRLAKETSYRLADIDLSLLEADLQGLAKAIRDNERAIKPLDSSYQDRMWHMPARIDTLLERFANRPIDMPELSSRRPIGPVA